MVTCSANMKTMVTLLLLLKCTYIECIAIGFYYKMPVCMMDGHTTGAQAGRPSTFVRLLMFKSVTIIIKNS